METNKSWRSQKSGFTYKKPKPKSTKKSKSKTPIKTKRLVKLTKYILKKREEMKNEIIKLFESKYIYYKHQT